MIPLFICTGFLDSGKTTLVKETIMKQDWIGDGLTVLVVCEEGEEEYSKEYLRENNMVFLRVEEFSQLNTQFFRNCERMYRPEQVIIEYNGMWRLEDLLSVKFPRNWELAGIYSTVDGQTLDMYLKNMRNLMMEQLTESEFILVNRCPDTLYRANFRRAVKVQNPMAQLIFEAPNGEIIKATAEDLPYDIKGEKIVIGDEDFGVWFVDVSEHPEYYLNKEIEFKAQTIHPKGMADNMFVPIRKIMTCCADDVGLYGYPCKAGKTIAIREMQWMKVRASVKLEEFRQGGGEQPVLHLIYMEPTEKPEDEIVYMG